MLRGNTSLCVRAVEGDYRTNIWGATSSALWQSLAKSLSMCVRSCFFDCAQKETPLCLQLLRIFFIYIIVILHFARSINLKIKIEDHVFAFNSINSVFLPSPPTRFYIQISLEQHARRPPLHT